MSLWKAHWWDTTPISPCKCALFNLILLQCFIFFPRSFKVIVHLFQVVVLSFALMPAWVLVTQCAFHGWKTRRRNKNLICIMSYIYCYVQNLPLKGTLFLCTSIPTKSIMWSSVYRGIVWKLVSITKLKIKNHFFLRIVFLAILTLLHATTSL